LTEVLDAAAQHLFTTTQANALYLGAFDGNPASLRVQEKVGFERAGVTRLHSNPKQLDLPQVNTVLSRTTHEPLNRHPHALS
jgi:RimJ/RimL family protein N-acetyltransferase